LSTRRWALGCGKSRGDTHRIIIELMEAGWIARTAESDGPHAATYTLGPKAVSAGQDNGTQAPQGGGARGKPGGTMSDVLTHLRTDVDGRRARCGRGAAALRTGERHSPHGR